MRGLQWRLLLARAGRPGAADKGPAHQELLLLTSAKQQAAHLHGCKPRSPLDQEPLSDARGAVVPTKELLQTPRSGIRALQSARTVEKAGEAPPREGVETDIETVLWIWIGSTQLLWTELISDLIPKD